MQLDLSWLLALKAATWVNKMVKGPPVQNAIRVAISALLRIRIIIDQKQPRHRFSWS